ncbi:ethanolamine utilization protein EutN [Cytobacillus oceanisediminis]|jgi:ethanolamine utilization protein EutN|uniref:Ethanolamine utilization protein EutN n=1 Tax=Cytobacillus oceanisediminis TaxID=665099 RepID=A0A2V3A5X6_9BACI|nr:EutN/CcmL family microcompartment protein [Cytobacillus oceanisediminis]PWW31978.1 ethanolamine utilization protein EutN [Cytobacillus oceanisediminis]
MQMGTVIGNVWATRKEDDLTGLKFLIVQPESPNESSAEGSFIAVDRIGAGVGDQVLVTRGSAAANMSGNAKLPIDALIIGIIDSIDVEKKGVK